MSERPNSEAHSGSCIESKNDVRPNKGPVNKVLLDKALLRSDALYEYILVTSVFPREPAPLRELREMSANYYPSSRLGITPDEGQFLMMLLKLINAKKTIELGVYTGYSLLCTALALPPDGKVIAMDINRENYELGVPFIKKAGVHHKVDFQEGKAIFLLDKLLEDDTNIGSFDFAFVDADKQNNLNYHEKLMKLLKVNGIIVYDNTLFYGTVASPDKHALSDVNFAKPFMLEFNKFLAVDPRIDISMVSLADGITVCKKL